MTTTVTPGGSPDGQVQPSPPSPPTPVTPDTGTTPVPAAPATGGPAQAEVVPPPAPASKTFGQDDVNEIVQKRLAAQEKALMAKFAKAFGVAPQDADPAKVAEQAQQQAGTYQKQAQAAMAESLAVLAGIKPDHVARFVKLVDLTGALKDVDPTDGTAVRAAIKTAVDAEAKLLPEWKGGALPASSGGDRQAGAAATLDEQIAAATKSGNWREAISLKRQKAHQP